MSKEQIAMLAAGAECSWCEMGRPWTDDVRNAHVATAETMRVDPCYASRIWARLRSFGLLAKASPSPAKETT